MCSTASAAPCIIDDEGAFGEALATPGLTTSMTGFAALLTDVCAYWTVQYTQLPVLFVYVATHPNTAWMLAQLLVS